MAKKLVPAEFKTHLINQILESVTEQANTAYYAFVGDHVTVASTLEEVNPPTESVRKLNSEVFRNMIFGKKMNASDMQFVINRHNWTPGTVYQMYDDEKIGLQDTNFYVLVDEDSFKHVYKCLFNNNGAPSTDKPLFKNAKFDEDLFVTGDDYYETSDGYQWKYMYSISSTNFSKFATEKYIPVYANTAVQAKAKEGSIDVVKVDFAGSGYNNYILGNKFEVADLNRMTAGIIAADPGATGAGHFDSGKAAQCYRIKTSTAAAQTLDYFKNTLIYIKSGVGAGQYRTITKSAYVSDLGGVFVQLDSQFSVLVDESSYYDITPKIEIIGSGNQTTNAAARAIMGSANSILKVEVLDTGADYSYASASVLEGEPHYADGIAVTPVQATVRPILSPQGGHGANTVIEFGARRLAFYMKYNRGESGLVEPVNTFSQFGIIRDPQFSNVQLYTSNTSGPFIEGETVTQISKINIQGNFTSNTTLANLIEASSPGDFNLHFDVGDYIFLETQESVPQYLLTTVGTGTTANTIALAETPYFATSTSITCTAYYVHRQSTAIVDRKLSAGDIPSGSHGITSGLAVKNCRPFFRKGRFIYGEESRNVATIAGIDINNRYEDPTTDFLFSDFNQMLKFIADDYNDGPFDLDELVTQRNSGATGRVHSVVSSGGSTTLNLTDITGKFNTTDYVDGATAELGPTAGNAIDIKRGDLDPNRGAILYLQNDIPVDRDENQSEEIRVILEF